MKQIVIILLVVFLSAAGYGQVSVIANKSVSETVLNATALANIYSLSLVKWNDGVKIVVFDQSSENPQKAKFYKFISKEPLALRKEWMKKQFSGEAKAPESLASDEEILKKVSSTSGSIGYVKSSSVDGSVKVLAEIK